MPKKTVLQLTKERRQARSFKQLYKNSRINNKELDSRDRLRLNKLARVQEVLQDKRALMWIGGQNERKLDIIFMQDQILPRLRSQSLREGLMIFFIFEFFDSSFRLLYFAVNMPDPSSITNFRYNL